MTASNEGIGPFWARGDCTDLRLNDEVVQMIAGVLPRVLTVAAIRDDMLLATEQPGNLKDGTWFCRSTGLEIDFAGIGAHASFISCKVGEL